MRIALIGSAPSSVALAPYEDTSWKFWGCSPGAYPYVRRWDAWFELHRWEQAPWFSAEYIQFMRSKPDNPVYMIRPVAEIPNSVSYPKDEMITRFGPWFFNSTLSWMFALAITQGATEIGLWGVDMSAQEEWIYQRSGCQFFIDMAKKCGIKVHIPPQSDLLRPPPLYGFSEEDHLYIKLHARKAELAARIDDALKREGMAREERIFLQGAMDDIQYLLKTWIADPHAVALAYAQPEWQEAGIQASVPSSAPLPEMPTAGPMLQVVEDSTGRKRRTAEHVSA